MNGLPEGEMIEFHAPVHVFTHCVPGGKDSQDRASLCISVLQGRLDSSRTSNHSFLVVADEDEVEGILQSMSPTDITSRSP